MTFCKGGGDPINGGSLICWILLILLLCSSLPPFRFIPQVSGDRSVACVQVGQNEEDGPFTIGGKRFRPIDRLPLRYAVLVGRVKTKSKTPQKWSGNYYYSKTYDPFHSTSVAENRGPCPRGWHLPISDIDKGNRNEKLEILNFANWCPGDVEIRTYLVQQNGRILRGWLHFEVEFTGNDDMEYIYVQIRDKRFNAIGEFVSDEKEQCKPRKEELISPTKYQFLPCSAIGPKEPKVSQAIFMAKTSQYADKGAAKPPYTTKKELSRGIHFTWRLNEYWCNHPDRFRVDALVWSRRSHENFRRANDGYNYKEDKFCDKDKYTDCQLRRRATDWIHPKWFGAADIKIDGDLDCTTPATVYKDWEWKLTPEAMSSWLGSSSRLKFADDYLYYYHRSLYTGEPWPYYKSCQVDPNPYGKNSDRKEVVTFGGRCKEYDHKDPDLINHHKCDEAPSGVDVKIFKNNYLKYLTNLTQQRLRQCSVDCQVPDINSKKDLEDIQSYERRGGVRRTVRSIGSTDREFKMNWETLSAKRREVRAVVFWATRKFHGNLCIFFSMFLIPVSNFLSRYYKETFMHNVSLGCAPWFWFHMLVCFAVPTLYHCSYSAMQQNIQNFRRSTSPHAVLHRAVGYVFIGMFILMICLGGLRCFAVGARMVCMALHSMSGFVLYILSINLIINSAYIPASPSLSKCAPETEGLPIGFSFSGWMAVAWLGIDLVFHLMLTALQRTVDKYYKIERVGLGIPFVPVLAPPTNVARDLDASILRKRVLIVYVIISLVFTFAAIGELYAKVDPGNCTLGNLTCDLTQVLPNMSSSPFGCSSSALKYYARIMQKNAENSTRTDL